MSTTAKSSDGYNHHVCRNTEDLHTQQIIVDINPAITLSDCDNVYRAVLNVAEIIRRRNNFAPATFNESIVATNGPLIDKAEVEFEKFTTQLDSLVAAGDLEGAKALARSVGVDLDADGSRGPSRESTLGQPFGFGPQKSQRPN